MATTETAASALEASFAQLCAEHDLTCVKVGLNLNQHEASRFGVTVHWDGYTRWVSGYISENGATIAEALTKTFERMRELRTPPLVPTLADEALPSIAA